jgi:hypothetical protein
MPTPKTNTHSSPQPTKTVPEGRLVPVMPDQGVWTKALPMNQMSMTQKKDTWAAEIVFTGRWNIAHIHFLQAEDNGAAYLPILGYIVPKAIQTRQPKPGIYNTLVFMRFDPSKAREACLGTLVMQVEERSMWIRTEMEKNSDVLDHICRLFSAKIYLFSFPSAPIDL